MIFRYDFDKNLDLVKFSKQAQHYISIFEEISYYLFLEKYKFTVTINKINESYISKLCLFDIKRNPSGDIVDSNEILPINDIRFNSLKEIVKIFPDDHIGVIECSSSKETSEKLIRLIKIVNKLENLKIYL
jgi:hypothetical protein